MSQQPAQPQNLNAPLQPLARLSGAANTPPVNNAPGNVPAASPVGSVQQPAPTGTTPQTVPVTPTPPPAPVPGNAPASSQPNQNVPGTRFSPLRSRPGPAKLDWHIVPVSDTLVRFDLSGLGDPFHRLLGRSLKLEFGESKAVINALQAGGELVETLAGRLAEAWTGYDLRGAALVYPWREEVRQAALARPQADRPEKKASEDQQTEDYFADTFHGEEADGAVPRWLRAIDLLVVLNVLARARSHVLLADAPLTFEQAFLERSLVSDDPRLVALVRATGFVEEAVGK